ncbi:MAG: hypothetical protein A2289_22075 [Deltaproteobacteria bacterium RIFOXYA12_FULL_58_15]|nr:MAG: hypothetical protein A2289_22075 [Deltaproteobacteria bacterium RIFOXYA12_FULL_58_15]OGR12287.1 MAG: hypothetical protein A2341_20910 [Deltaproteobacteria bacterium RIFOXYB12_FULL_58_9]
MLHGSFFDPKQANGPVDKALKKLSDMLMLDVFEPVCNEAAPRGLHLEAVIELDNGLRGRYYLSVHGGSAVVATEKSVQNADVRVRFAPGPEDVSALIRGKFDFGAAFRGGCLTVDGAPEHLDRVTTLVRLLAKVDIAGAIRRAAF